MNVYGQVNLKKLVVRFIEFRQVLSFKGYMHRNVKIQV